MNIKNRLKKIEAVRDTRTATSELYGITLDQWRRQAAGEDILPEIRERNRAAFFHWHERAPTFVGARRRKR